MEDLQEMLSKIEDPVQRAIFTYLWENTIPSNDDDDDIICFEKPLGVLNWGDRLIEISGEINSEIEKAKSK